MESLWHHHHNKRSCCSIRHSCSPHKAHKHNLVAWHHKGCKVFHPWFCFVISPSSLCIKIWGKLPSQGEGEQVRLSPALPLQKRCQLWQLSPPPWLRSLLREQRILHVLQLEGLQFPYGFCQHGLSDHAASLIRNHIDHIWFCWSCKQSWSCSNANPPVAGQGLTRSQNSCRIEFSSKNGREISSSVYGTTWWPQL